MDVVKTPLNEDRREAEETVIQAEIEETCHI